MKREHGNRRKPLLILLLTVLLGLSMAFALTGCGTSDSDDSGSAASSESSAAGDPVIDEDAVPEDADFEGEDEFAYEVDPYAEMSEAELKTLKKKAKEQNKLEESFYGTWVGDKDVTYDVYGSLEITIKKNHTFDMNLSDGEEVFSGTWKKTEDGIAYTSELMSGTIYYGEYDQLTIDNDAWDYDDEDEGLAVTLHKKGAE